jgi:predicted nucleotidyltransferase
MKRDEILEYLKSKKALFKSQYGITTLGLYGSYSRNEANKDSDIDIFYERDKNFKLKSGLDFMFLSDKIAEELHIKKVDFVNLKSMNPIIKYTAKKDFIYV